MLKRWARFLTDQRAEEAVEHNMSKKWLISLLCALPFLGVLLWFIAGKNMNTTLTLGLILACPLSHMFLMNHHKSEGGDDHGKKQSVS